MNNTIEAVAPEVALKTWLRPDLTPIGPNQDYAALRDQLAGLDQLLANSHLEAMAVDFARENWRGDDVAGLPRHLAVRAQGAAGAGIAHDARENQLA
ncbi:MAG: hypothetical protein J6386_19315 [Candidatus Synoicihabitans palmerolidicus]|nr:hypothetical protein [Candidatus Synoicihabitans palmerolidicus]MCC5024803.1 hypothetical protein [Candidatus Synoicihabitans palmerolidicus]